jgi:hypothetical protein
VNSIGAAPKAAAIPAHFGADLEGIAGALILAGVAAALAELPKAHEPLSLSPAKLRNGARPTA